MEAELSKLKEKHSTELQEMKKKAQDEQGLEIASLHNEHEKHIKEVERLCER